MIRWLSASSLVVFALLGGCVPVQPLTLSRPATTGANELTVHVGTLAASNAFLSQHGEGEAVLAADVAIANRSPGAAELEVERATLVLSDPAGELREITLAAWTSGAGRAPRAIPASERPLPVHASPGEIVSFWVAFRASGRLADADVPRRIVLRIPVRGAPAPVEVLLADPSTGRPRWELPMVRHASYGGVSAAGTFDEASFGILRTSGKSVAGPLVIGPSLSLGFRGGTVRGERERTIVCCDLGVSFDVSAPVLTGPLGSAGPYLGYHGLFALEEGRIDQAAWHGPSAGLQFFSRPIDPRTSTALPIRTARTPLGYAATTLAYVHWFRRGDPGGSPGFFVTFEHTLPEL